MLRALNFKIRVLKINDTFPAPGFLFPYSFKYKVELKVRKTITSFNAKPYFNLSKVSGVSSIKNRN